MERLYFFRILNYNECGDIMKKRVISAAVMLAIFIPLLIIGGIPFRIAVGIIAILGYKEFLDLKKDNKYPLPVAIIGLLILLFLTMYNTKSLALNMVLDYRILIGAFLALSIPSLFYFKTKNYSTSDALKLFGFILFLGTVLNVATNIMVYNKLYFYMLLIVTIMTDTFAYLTGVSIGKHKFSKISPKKSIEGCIGGIVLGSIVTSIYYMTFIGTAPIYKVVLVTIVLSIVCEVGDLFYSAIKRENDIKDFSNLIPGHGGVLDRIDSLTFVMATYILLMGII